MAEPTSDSKVSQELIGMSREDALRYLELPENANDYEIEERFWQLSKRSRAIKDDAERIRQMNDLSYVLDVATGREEARLKALADREAAKKYFGKTAEEWKVYFGYTWYKYLLVLIGILVIGALLYRIFFTPDEDISVISVGHYQSDPTLMEVRLKDEGFKNPYCTNVDYVAPNDEGQTGNMYNEMTASVILASNPDIVITDELSYIYQFGQFADMGYFYDELKEELPADKFSKITPVYCSEYDAVEKSIEYQEKSDTGEVDRSDLQTANTEEIMVGLKIEDEALIYDLGFKTLWRDMPEHMIISFGVNGTHRSSAEGVIKGILNELN